jgi:hypothetical protein
VVSAASLELAQFQEQNRKELQCVLRIDTFQIPDVNFAPQDLLVEGPAKVRIEQPLAVK